MKNSGEKEGNSCQMVEEGIITLDQVLSPTKTKTTLLSPVGYSGYGQFHRFFFRQYR